MINILVKNYEMVEAIGLFFMAFVLRYATGIIAFVDAVLLFMLCFFALKRQIKNEGGFNEWLKNFYRN